LKSTERENRREEILEAAGDLFVRQGYSGTSTREIADAVGCTKAALYYHFKDGKEELYQEAFKSHGPDMGAMLIDCETASSLNELFLLLAANMKKQQPQRIRRMRWIIAEYPNLNESQRQMLRAKKEWLLESTTDLIARFVADRQEAKRAATLLIAAIVGYDQFFAMTETELPDGDVMEGYLNFFGELLSARYGE